MASSSPSREQSTDKDCIDFMVSDDVPSESQDICKTEIPITTFNLKRIDPSIPRPYPSYIAYLRDNSSYVPTGEAEEGDFQPKKKYKSGLIIPPVQISTCTCSSSKGNTSANMDDVYVPLAKKALAYYNAKENTNLSFVEVNVASYQCGRKNKIHMNFIASLEDGVEKLLFAELVDGSIRKLKTEHIDEFHVKGCCWLQEIESGNPHGWGCAMCRKEVIHPGPRHGYMTVGGDRFEGYPFWGYRSAARASNPTPDDEEMYFACAMIALNYFNSKQSTDFVAVEVLGSFTCPCPHKIIVHINFKCITSIEPKQQLFFAELVVPNFTVDCGKWDIRKEPFVVVKGCCLLEKVGSGNSFGRVCELCYCKEVIHPGPKDGYRVAVGDEFTGYGFMNIGGGVF